MPTPPAVLVSSAAAKVLLVQSFKAAGAKVIAVESSPMSAALTFADVSYLVPRLDADGALEALLGLCRRERIGLLVPTRDGELPFFATHADAFRAVGTRVLVSSPAALETCQDKRRFIDTCQRLGIPVPHTWTRSEVPGRWPVFVRPNRGASATGAVRVADRRALDCLQSEGGDLVVQEFVSSPEYSIDVLSDFDAQPLQAVARRRVQIRAGESSVSRVERRAGLEAMAMRLCGAIGIVGHAVVQAFDDDRNGPRFIEVNPRFGGASNLSIAAGLDSPARLLALLGGDLSARAARPIRDTLAMLRFSQDVLIDAAQLNYPSAAGS